MDILKFISYSIIPAILTVILVYGLIKRVDIYGLFAEGAKEGIHTAAGIMPYMIAIFVAIAFFTASGALDRLEQFSSPVCKILGFPTELLSLLFIKPVSGSGGLAVVKTILEQYGADTYIGRVASVMMGSAETIFYTIAIYFGVTSVKKYRYVMISGLVAYFAGVTASIIICKYI